jgi:glycosyltransferase involved in cell wall biosynthesis
LHDAAVPVVLTIHNYRLMCANAQLFRDGHPCTDCVGSHPWHGVAHRCYRNSATASAVAAATIWLARARGTWDLVDRFVTPSQFVRSVLISAGASADRIVVRPEVVSDPGHRLSRPSSSSTVLYAGRLAPEKGIDVLMDAWERAEPDLGDLTLDVIGDGPLRGRLEHRSGARVRFLGWLSAEELRRRMLSARALVLPSQWPEIFGRVTAEAMAAGLPVLASDIGTPGEVVGELGPEWLVPAADTAAWASGLCGLADGVAVNEAGIRARELFERRYSPARASRDLVEIYDSVRRRVTTSTLE